METFSALLAICAGHSQRPVTLNFDVFFICAWINGWVNNDEACDLRRHRAHYVDTVNDCIVFNKIYLHLHIFTYPDLNWGLVQVLHWNEMIYFLYSDTLSQQKKHPMMTSWHENSFRITGPFVWGIHPPVTDGFPSQRTNDANLWCIFGVTPNKHSSCRWSETPWRTWIL